MKRNKISPILPVVPLLLALWLVFVPLAVHRPAMYDETFTYLRYAQSPVTALFFYELPNNHLLHSFGVWVMTTLAGDSLLAIRFVSIAAALLCAAQLFRLTARIFGWGAGLLAAAALMIVPLWAEQISNGRGYTLSALLTLIFVEQIYFSVGAPTRAQKRALLLICLLLMLTLPSMLLLIAAGGLWILGREWLAGRWRHTLAGYTMPMIFGTVLGSLPYAVAAVMHITSFSANQFGEANFGVLVEIWTRNVFGTPFALVLVTGMAAGAVLLWVRGPRRMLALTASVFGVAVAASLVQYILTDRVFFARNFYYLVPFVALLAGIGLAWVLRFSLLAPVMGAAVLFVFGVSVFQPLYAPTEISRVVDSIGTQTQAGDLLVIGCCVDIPARYVYRDVPALFEYTPDTRRIVLISTPLHSADVLFSQVQDSGISMDRAACIPEMWGGADVLICPVGPT